MYCPACDKEFSPVHSRCPECKGWLRVSGPTVGAKAAPAARSVATSSGVETQRVNGPSNMPLPSRPGGKPAAPAAAVAPTVSTPPAVGPPAGLGGPTGLPVAPPAARPEPVGPAPAAIEPVPSSGRGALGSGWESSNEIGGASLNSWGAPAAPASPSPSGGLGGGGWGGVSSAPANPAAPPMAPASSWGAPSNPMETGKMPAWGSPSGGLGAGPALGGPGLGGGSAGLGGGAPVGMGSGPPSGALTPPSGSLGSPPSGGLGGGGGWLGDGGNASPYAPPPRAGGGWLGNEANNDAPAVLSASAELSPAQPETPALSLPDHTVAVDLGTPWEEEIPQVAQSNKGVYAVLGVFLLLLVGFLGYLKHQQSVIKKTPVVSSTGSGTTSSLELGMQALKTGQAHYKNRRWLEAQSSAELANNLVSGLSSSVAPADKKKAVSKFFQQSTTRAGLSFYDQASQALAGQDFSSAIGLAERSAQMYAKAANTKKEQARAYALQGNAYGKLRDYVSSQSAYKKAYDMTGSSAYKASFQEARRMTATTSQPVEVANMPQEAPVQPSLGDDNVYPNGSGVRGSGGSRTTPASSGGDNAPAAVQRPRQNQSTYTPPRKDNTPSFMRKKDQRPPGY
jgi:hypothetical protein